MGLESFSYITSLNASNPVHATDQVSVGDDHLRGVKTTLLNSFPQVAGAVTVTHTEFNNLDGVTGKTGTGNLVLSASPTLTGTLTAAAIAATTYDGVAAANLVDKSATEAIAGEWTFSDLIGGVMVATSYGGILEANLVDKSAAETIAGVWAFGTITATLATVTTLNIGNADTSITRDAAGQIAVEGDAVFTHEAGSYTSAKIHFSDGTEPTTEGAGGDIFLVY